MNSIDAIRFQMQKVADARDVVKQEQQQIQKRKSHKNVDLSQIQKVENPFEQQFLSLESKFLATFHAENSRKNISNIGLYVITFSNSNIVFLMQICYEYDIYVI